MKPFSTELQFDNADLFYEQLLDAHQGLSRDASEAMNARLILVMANQIGDMQALSRCVQAAQSTKAAA